MRDHPALYTGEEQRKLLWEQVIEIVEEHFRDVTKLRVSPILEKDKILEAANQFQLDTPLDPEVWLPKVISFLKDHIVHVDHPMYYGLYNPKPNFASILADLVTATFNPQMAAWSHAPYAVEIEQLLVHQVGKRMGYPTSCQGIFGAGGAEANLTAVICALNNRFPDYAKTGLFGIKRRPIIYVSEHAHHSIIKAASSIGLGMDSVQTIDVDKMLKMHTGSLIDQIKEDRSNGKIPFMVVSTVGATGTGTIDPISPIRKIADDNNMWLHVDAAWGGAVSLFESHRHLTDGIEKSDSITFDIHKWMSVPMGTSMYLTRHTDILNRSFRITADYMPKDGDTLQVMDPYTHSIQWSRKFLGLRFYFALLMYGWSGYESMVSEKLRLGAYLKNRLTEESWNVVYHTPLPVVCFEDGLTNLLKSSEEICQHLNDSGKTWLSTYPISGKSYLRACITNFMTTENEIDHLIQLLNQARSN